VEVDEFPRPQTTAAKLASMDSPFRDGGTVTAGNSSGVNDGAAAIGVVSGESVERLGLDPVARIVDWAVVGCDPVLMGRGPVPATEALFARTGLGADDMDVIEINEAFAVVVLNAVRELGLDPTRVNRHGGAISIGHPPGATGIRMAMVATNELRRSGGRYGLLTMCLGAGQGMSMIVENVRR
jgi:acetyl-CoA acetyltransferase family protein